MPNQLFSIDLLQPKVIDSVGDDKIYPPHFKTVQNRQPIPEGAFKKRDGLAEFDATVALASDYECQLATPFFLKGSSVTDAVFACSSPADAACDLYSYVGTTLAQLTDKGSGSPESSLVVSGFYYVANALTTVSNVITPVLILVKADR